MDREQIAELIDQWHSGSDRESAFRTLAEAFYPAVQRYFERRIQRDLADDLTQETFFRIYKVMSGFRREARFESWLFQIAANVLRQALRGRRAVKRRAETEAESMSGIEHTLRESSAAGADLRLLQAERRQRLSAAVSGLPPQMRACLKLRIYQELSYGDIAQVMGLSLETVKAHLYQARRRLRAELESPNHG